MLAEAAEAQAAASAASGAGVFARLCAARSARFDGAPDGWPALPTDTFRYARVVSFDPSEDVHVFRTSGTTSGARGEHAFRSLGLYERAAERMARRALFGEERLRLVLLAPHPRVAPDSSLSFMLERFTKWFGLGEPIWAFGAGGVDVDAIRRALEGAREPVGILGTSFALVHFLDAIDEGERFPLPLGSLVMQTGGLKGRAREIQAAELRALLSARFDLAEHRVVSEYGMTELSSQLYGDGLERGGLHPDGRERLLVPPWVRVTPVDPDTLRPVVRGATGVLRIDDLANLDSCVSIQTADLGLMDDDRLVLLGRAPGATPRGCSLAIEEALERSP